MEAELLYVLRRAMTGSRYWDRFETGWACLDCGLLSVLVEEVLYSYTEPGPIVARGMTTGRWKWSIHWVIQIGRSAMCYSTGRMRKFSNRRRCVRRSSRGCRGLADRSCANGALLSSRSHHVMSSGRSRHDVVAPSLAWRFVQQFAAAVA
jgi:hypothetical protein